MGCKNECIVSANEETDIKTNLSQSKSKHINFDYQSQNSTISTFIFNMESLRDECLHYANILRKRHYAPDLILNDDLNKIAQSHAVNIAETDNITKSNNKYHDDLLGENAYTSTQEMTGNAIISEWYNESEYLKGLEDQYTLETKNYTQLIWKNSKLVGFGFAKSKTGLSYCVANFYPQGNTIDFDKNVNSVQTMTQTIEKAKHGKPIPMSNHYEDIEDNMMELSNRFMKDAFKTQNEYRIRHHVQPLKMNKEICCIAQNYAMKMATNDIFQQSNNEYKDEELGESFYMCQGKAIIGKDVIDNWYNEKKVYDFNRGEFNCNAGHFTQMVWKNSTDVGFGCAKSISGIYYAVVNYYPPGNYQDAFLTNVFPSDSDN